MMDQKELALSVVLCLRAEGHTAYFVGGCVRDTLLGRTPKDYDVATSARPEQITALFPDTVQVGASFGVVLVRHEHIAVEVATYRNDGVYSDARRPDSVEFVTDWKQDVLRRDFTINAMMMDPMTGEVMDCVGGEHDIRNGVIRAVGNPAARFQEDYLRMLRAVRFAARFDFVLDQSAGGTAEALTEHAAMIADVAAERVQAELSRILTEGGARHGFGLMQLHGLLPVILPEVSDMRGVQQPPQYHPEGDVWTHTMIMLEGLKNPTLELALGVLLHDVGKPGTFVRAPDRIRFDGHVELGVELTRKIMARLKYSNAVTDQVVALVDNHMKFAVLSDMRTSKLKRFLRMDRFDEHMELHRQDCLSASRGLSNIEFCRQKLAELPPEVLRPVPLVTGHDLIAAGLTPGKRFSVALKAVDEAQLEGTVTTQSEALALAMTVYNDTGFELTKEVLRQCN